MSEKETTKNKGGRPRKEVDWPILDATIVWASCSYCAEKLDMSNDTLTERIKEKYDMSFPEYKYKRQESVRLNLLTKQYEVAMNGNTTMLIWLGKQHLGQRDKFETEITQVELPSSYEIVTYGKDAIDTTGNEIDGQGHVQEQTQDNNNSE